MTYDIDNIFICLAYLYRKWLLSNWCLALLISSVIWTIGVTIDFSPTEIQTDATYVFTLAVGQLIAAGGVINIKFPSDFDFSSQATNDETKTWEAISGFTFSFTGNNLEWVLNKNDNTLKATLVYPTTLNQISFNASLIRNPTYAKRTSGFSIQVFNSSTATNPIDSSASTTTILATTGTLGAVFEPEFGVVGARVSYRILHFSYS